MESAPQFKLNASVPRSGTRPKKSAKDAIKAIRQNIYDGHQFVRVVQGATFALYLGRL